MLSKWLWDIPWGCEERGQSLNKFTTLTNLITRPGRFFLSILVAAKASNVGTSPAHAMMMSGSRPLSLDAHSQIPRPAAQWLEKLQ